MTIASSSEETTILTIDQAAAYLTIPKATLYTWRTRRVGFGPPAVKLGGCLRYRRSRPGRLGRRARRDLRRRSTASIR